MRGKAPVVEGTHHAGVDDPEEEGTHHGGVGDPEEEGTHQMEVGMGMAEIENTLQWNTEKQIKHQFGRNLWLQAFNLRNPEKILFLFSRIQRDFCSWQNVFPILKHCSGKKLAKIKSTRTRITR